MRAIQLGPILVFNALVGVALAASVATVWLLWSLVPPGDFRGVVCAGAFVLALYGFAIPVYRAFLYFYPLHEGPVAPGSRLEFTYHVYLLFYLLLFYPLTRSKFLPVPLMRLIYLALGAKLGRNTYSSGTILDPPLTFIGDNTIIGQDAVLYSHAIEGAYLSHAAIRIGHNATVGANAVVMSGVTIGDGAIVAAGAVVIKGTIIESGEAWGGVPARRLHRFQLETEPASPVRSPVVAGRT